METEAERAFRSGTITQADKIALHTIVGHSQMTCLNYYVMCTRLEDAETAFNAFQKIVREKGEHDHHMDFSEEEPGRSQWGLSHPCKEMVGKVMYTDKERAIMGVLVDKVFIFHK